jgi:hypothetical protein
MARNDRVTPDREDMRKDLLAALAAARELGPEMDSSLVDAHLRRHYGEQPQRAVQPRPRTDRAPLVTASTLAPMVMALCAVLCVAAFVALASFGHGFGFWFFLPLLFFGFGMRRARWGRHYGRYYGRRWDRYDRRWDRYGRSDGDSRYTDDDPHYVRYDAPRVATERPGRGELI